jgi:hypothetical protein
LWDPISKKPITKIGLVEWLKVKALSSNPTTTKGKEKTKKKTEAVVFDSLIPEVTYLHFHYMLLVT